MTPPLRHAPWPARLARALGYRPELRVRAHEIELDALAGVPPLRVAYASDFHAGPTTHPALLEAACEALAAAEPDLLLLGGDFVNRRVEELDQLAPLLGAIPAPLGRYAVLGNHDWLAGGPLVPRLTGLGIDVLTNRNVRLPEPYDDLWLCGLDDHWHGHPDAGAAVAGAHGTRLILMHQPSGLLDLGGEPFAVAFCGHTHGGQIAFPGGTPIVVPYGRLSRRYSRGRYRLEGGRELIVSVGIGCTVLPFRFAADPEVLVCTLRGPPGPAQNTV